MQGRSKKLSGAKMLAETLKGYGVTHVFHVPAILRRALVEMELLEMHRVLVHTEKAAAYMADGYARVSHRPGICMSQSVGAANLAAGLQDAFLGLSPVIAITGRKPPRAQYRNAYQEILHGPMFDPVTKYNVSISTLEQLAHCLRQAFREATSGAPGPVHLDVIGNLGEELELAEDDLEVISEKTFSQYPSVRLEPSIEVLQEVAKILQRAKRPVIIAGGGSSASGAGAEILELAEMLSIPIATSLNGKAIIPENHSLSVGVVGSYGRCCANQVVLEADTVLFIGSHTGDQVTCDWQVPNPGATQIIQIDIDPAELGRNYPNTAGVVGDASLTVRKLIGLLQPKEEGQQWMLRAQQLVREWWHELEPLLNSRATPMRPERLCKELTEVLPHDAVLVSDTGNSAIWTGTMVCLTHPGQTYIRSAGSLGWAFPASLGAKCAVPERPVICFTGDGGLWYHLSELETALRFGINTVTVVNNNHGFGQCFGPTNRAYGQKLGKREELYEFREVNFARIAEEIGCFSIRVESPAELGGAITRALQSKVPAVVEVITDIASETPKPLMPSQAG